MSKITIEKVLQKAEEAVERLDYFMAAKFYQKALDMEPNNTHIMDDFAQTLLELGETSKATQLLKESITKEPMGGYEKYMNFGQLLRGKEAIECFDKGIQLMITFFNQLPKNDHAKRNQISEQISSAFCSIAEIFLTDLCMEEGAEKDCEKNVENAIKWNENNAEVFVLKANLLLSQNRTNEAIPVLQKSYSLWKNLDETKWPNYAIQLQTAKMMIEVALPDDAAEILELLVEQEDLNSEVWYLLGLCYFGDGDVPKHANASFDCLTKSRDLLVKMGEERPAGALEQVEELLTKVTPFYKEDDDNIEDIGEDEDEDMEN